MANSLPAINDVTASEIPTIVAAAAKVFKFKNESMEIEDLKSLPRLAFRK